MWSEYITIHCAAYGLYTLDTPSCVVALLNDQLDGETVALVYRPNSSQTIVQIRFNISSYNEYIILPTGLADSCWNVLVAAASTAGARCSVEGRTGWSGRPSDRWEEDCVLSRSLFFIHLTSRRAAGCRYSRQIDHVWTREREAEAWEGSKLTLEFCKRWWHNNIIAKFVS